MVAAIAQLIAESGNLLSFEEAKFLLFAIQSNAHRVVSNDGEVRALQVSPKLFL